MLQSENMVVDWIKKKKNEDPLTSCLQLTHFRPKDTHSLKDKWWKIYFMQIEEKIKLGKQYFCQIK